LSIRNTTWSCAGSLPVSWVNSPIMPPRPCGVATLKRPLIPKCMTSTSPLESRASRYLARRPRLRTFLPCRRSVKCSGKGNRRSGRRSSTCSNVLSTRKGSSPRRTISTSGSSGTHRSLAANGTHAAGAACSGTRFEARAPRSIPLASHPVRIKSPASPSPPMPGIAGMHARVSCATRLLAGRRRIHRSQVVRVDECPTEPAGDQQERHRDDREDETAVRDAGNRIGPPEVEIDDDKRDHTGVANGVSPGCVEPAYRPCRQKVGEAGEPGNEAGHQSDDQQPV